MQSWNGSGQGTGFQRLSVGFGKDSGHGRVMKSLTDRDCLDVSHLIPERVPSGLPLEDWIRIKIDDSIAISFDIVGIGPIRRPISFHASRLR